MGRRRLPSESTPALRCVLDGVGCRAVSVCEGLWCRPSRKIVESFAMKEANAPNARCMCWQHVGGACARRGQSVLPLHHRRDVEGLRAANAHRRPDAGRRGFVPQSCHVAWGRDTWNWRARKGFCGCVKDASASAVKSAHRVPTRYSVAGDVPRGRGEGRCRHRNRQRARGPRLRTPTRSPHPLTQQLTQCQKLTDTMPNTIHTQHELYVPFPLHVQHALSPLSPHLPIPPSRCATCARWSTSRP